MGRIEDHDLSGKKVLIRVDLNVPLDKNFEVTDETRIKAALSTIRKVIDDGGSAILLSHLGRPKGFDQSCSLKHLIPRLNELLGRDIHFAPDCIGDIARHKADQLKPGEVLLLENLRFHPEEKEGDQNFGEELAALGTFYINDAFGVAHRAHTSTATIAEFFEADKRSLGYLIEREIQNLDHILETPGRPMTGIIGGTKVSGKINTIFRLLERIDRLLIGGGMTYTFVKARGGNVGDSVVEADKLQMAEDIMRKADERGVDLYIPTDSIIADEFSNEANTDQCRVDDIPEGWMGMDLGNETIQTYRQVIEGSKSILWNGPMGVFEKPNFEQGTRAVAESVVKATREGAFSLVGGGDSVGALQRFGMVDEVSFVSTGGGAMLEFIEGKELPGISAFQ